MVGACGFSATGGRIFLWMAAVILAAMAGPTSRSAAAEAACPAEWQDMKNLTVTGRISDMWRDATFVYHDKSKSTHAITVRECKDLTILVKRPPSSCRKGATVTAMGRFHSCEEDFKEQFCEEAELYATSVTCR